MWWNRKGETMKDSITVVLHSTQKKPQPYRECIVLRSGVYSDGRYTIGSMNKNGVWRDEGYIVMTDVVAWGYLPKIKEVMK